RQGVVIRDPYRASQERRAEEDQEIERARLGISQAAEARQQEALNKAPDGYRWTNGPGSALEIIPGGPADPATRSQGLTAEGRTAALNEYNTRINLADGVQKLKKQLRDSFQGRNAAEYLPGFARPENAVFDSTSGTLNACVATALGLSGQQFN